MITDNNTTKVCNKLCNNNKKPGNNIMINIEYSFISTLPYLNFNKIFHNPLKTMGSQINLRRRSFSSFMMPGRFQYAAFFKYLGNGRVLRH